MEKEKSSPAGQLPGNGFLWLAIVAAGVVVVHQVPWQDSRPLGPEPKAYRYEAEQDIDARLWQDPFSAVARGRQEFRKSAARPSSPAVGPTSDPPGHLASDLNRTISRSRGEHHHPLIVGTMVSGGAYPDYVESRRRARYAVLAGLSQMGFMPDDPEHLGYFIPEASSGEERLPEFIAYEWLSRTDEELSSTEAALSKQLPDRVLLLWLDESVIGAAPLAKVERIWGMLCNNQSAIACSRKTLPFVVLGPDYSTSLQAMAKEVRKSPARSFGGALFYAYGATAADRQILPEVPAGSPKIQKSLNDFFGDHQVRVVRTIGTDDILAKQLATELCLRGVNPIGALNCGTGVDGSTQRVVLVRERDSVYSHSLALAMKRCLSDDHCTPGASDNEPQWIQDYTYLRGLDGQRPTLQSGESSESGKKDSSDKDNKSGESGRSDAEKRIERAEGQSQFDYLRRLAAQMRGREDDSRVRGQGEIRAIGVLGSDVYDKLVVLQALRSEFPNAIFFTTDLDARLLHPRERAWTRNLIIASSFGLQLHRSLQRDIPPFRDSYQTSLYLATLIALNNAQPSKTQVDQEMIQNWFKQPRLFEVGRRAPFDLSAALGGACDRVAGLANCKTIHPQPSPLVPQPLHGSLFILLAVLLILFLLLLLASGVGQRAGVAVRKWVYRGQDYVDSTRVSAVAVSGAMVIAGLVCLGFWIDDLWQWLGKLLTQNGEGEPIALLEGVSVWPSQVIRVFTFVLSVICVIFGWRALDKNLDDISREMMFQPPRGEILRQVREEQHDWPWWKRVIRVFSFRLVETNGDRINPSTGLTPAAEAFWRKYTFQGRLGARFLRVFAATALYVALAGVVIYCFGPPHTPYRGDVSRIADRFIIFPSVIAMQFLLFFVVDATVFCYQFITELRRDLPDRRILESGKPPSLWPASRWPQSTLGHYAAKLRVDKRYLDDWISMHCIARRTRLVGRLIYLPFIVISLMMLARSSVFDNWTMPTGLLIVFAGSVLIVAGCAILLRWGAEVSRRKAVWRLTNELIPLKGRGEEDRRLAEQIQVMINQIGEFKSGAFAPYSQQPFVRALLLPLGTYGGTVLLEFLTAASL